MPYNLLFPCARSVPVDWARGYLCAFSFDPKKVLMNEKSVVPREAVHLGMVGSWGLQPPCVCVQEEVPAIWRPRNGTAVLAFSHGAGQEGPLCWRILREKRAGLWLPCAAAVCSSSPLSAFVEGFPALLQYLHLSFLLL